jgi:hypothetical protein
MPPRAALVGRLPRHPFRTMRSQAPRPMLASMSVEMCWATLG